MKDFVGEIAGKKVLVFGLGRQGGGVGDAAWLTKQRAIVRVSDKDTTLVPEGQTRAQIEWADIIIKNPGVPDDNELITYGHSLGKEIYTSIALFVKYAAVQTIGVTGTRGKSTTVALINELLEHVYPGRVLLGGNIAGTSCLSLFDQLAGKEYAVLELSSFQLHNFHDLKISPNIAIITNLYPDHLNRYPTMRDYQRDKEAIVLYQKPTDVTLYNQDNPGSIAIAKVTTGKSSGYTASNVVDWQTSLPGLHNRENIAAMFALSQIIGISIDVAKQEAGEFRGVPSRQETIRVVSEVAFINDTTATTPVAALMALRAQSSPFIWITGGDTKNLPFDELIDEVSQNKYLKHIVILGSKNIPEYVTALEECAKDKIIGKASSMQSAIDLCRTNSVAGDTILLSPGFASFDLFKNEFDRGDQFNKIVKALDR